MGTRNLTAVYYNGEYRIAQYGQWDGYPEGQGHTVLEFLNNPKVDLEKFKEYLMKLSWITEEEYRTRWAEAGANPDSDFVDMKIAEDFRELYPELSRDTGAGVLERVYEKKGELKLQNNIEFAQDSLFCEWAYVIDLDANTLEVYRGFVLEPIEGDERFFNEEPPEKNKTGNTYYPISLFHRYSLEELPSADEFIEQMRAKLEKEYDEEENE